MVSDMLVLIDSMILEIETFPLNAESLSKDPNSPCRSSGGLMIVPVAMHLVIVTSLNFESVVYIYNLPDGCQRLNPHQLITLLGQSGDILHDKAV